LYWSLANGTFAAVYKIVIAKHIPMRRWLVKHARYPFPQNFLFRQPALGSLISGLCCFIFMVLYMPLRTHPSVHFGYALTMGLYTLTASSVLWMAIRLLRYTNLLGSIKSWTLASELLAVTVVLGASGIAVFAVGFILEPDVLRWTVGTLANSMGSTMLVGAIPFLFFTAISASTVLKGGEALHDESEPQIRINSQLKKEDLRFLPSQLLYAESDGNYVTFYLLHEKGVRTKSIRNSISQIEEQLKGYPYFVRTHRAFIVNLRYVASYQGNSAGYKLKLENITIDIPVSRQKAEVFEAAIAQQGS